MPNDELCCGTCCHCEDHDIAQDCKLTGEATTLESCCAKYEGITFNKEAVIDAMLHDSFAQSPTAQVFTDAQEECLHSQMERLKADVLLEAYATINRTFAVLMGSD